MKKRGLILLTMLVMSFLSVAWMNMSDGGPLVAPDVDLSVIPATIDGWKGVDIELDEETDVVLGATSSINRLYNDALGRQVSFHAATWKNEKTINPAPHHPQVCYAGAGWRLLDRRSVEVPSATGPVPMELILFEKDGSRVVTGHWFRVGEAAFLASDGFQKQRRRFWGLKYWPNSTKFLLHTVSPSLDAAEGTLIEFASLINDRMANQPAVSSPQGT